MVKQARTLFDREFVHNAISRSAENPVDRRNFLRGAGVAGLGVVGAGAIGSTMVSGSAGAAEISDGAILNFALNLEYLEAQFYSFAATGKGLPSSMLSGKGDQGEVSGGSQVPFKSKKVRQIAQEIYRDERDHVAFLRTALAGAQVAQPSIDLKKSFTAAAMAAGVIKSGEFDPFSSEENFLLGAYIFEDVGVTAYKGAAPLISNKTYLGAAAGILAVEAYHAGIIRTRISDLGGDELDAANKISDARDSLDGSSDDDQGPSTGGQVNIVPTDKNSITYSRTPGAVLNIVYLSDKKVSKGGFFPDGMNGDLKTSGS